MSSLERLVPQKNFMSANNCLYSLSILIFEKKSRLNFENF